MGVAAKKRKRAKGKPIGKRPISSLRRTDPRKVAHEAQVAQCLNLRVHGWTMKAISVAVGVSETTVLRYLDEGIKGLGVDQKAHDLRTLEVQRLDAITTALMPKAEAGDHFAITSFLSVQDRRMKIAGVAPKNDDAGATATANVIVFSSDDEKL